MYIGNTGYPKEPLHLLPLIPRRNKPHIVLPGQITLECNYGPDRNQRQKKKWAFKKDKDKM